MGKFFNQIVMGNPKRPVGLEPLRKQFNETQNKPVTQVATENKPIVTTELSVHDKRVLQASRMREAKSKKQGTQNV